jgi:hypothetical protein
MAIHQVQKEGAQKYRLKFQETHEKEITPHRLIEKVLTFFGRKKVVQHLQKQGIIKAENKSEKG